MSEKKNVHIEYEGVVISTPKAVCYRINGQEVWMPKSEIIEDNEDTKTVLITGWIAEKKELT